MNEEELKCLNLLAEAWNIFVKLPVEHESDTHEFQHHLHILERQLMSRPTRRNLKDL